MKENIKTDLNDIDQLYSVLHSFEQKYVGRKSSRATATDEELKELKTVFNTKSKYYNTIYNAIKNKLRTLENRRDVKEREYQDVLKQMNNY